MDKKRFIIFGALSIFAIICAFFIVKAFTPNSTKITGKSSNDTYIDIGTYLEEKKLEKLSEKIPVDSSSADDEIVVSEVSSSEETDTEVVVDTSTLNGDNSNLSAYERYLKEAESTGMYDFSDVKNTVFNEYESTLERKVSSEDIKFFNSLQILADNYTMAYEEAFSYVLSSDLNILSEYIEGDYSIAIDDFSTLETNGNDKFEKIKSDYYNGMLQSRDGFRVYIQSPDSEDCNEYFYKADEYFYNGQSKLVELLEDYK